MSHTPDLNPYASPLADQQTPKVLPLRAQARSYVRRTLLILAIGVGVNIWANFYWTEPYPRLSYDTRPPLVIGNAIFFSVVFAVLWFVALRLIEFIAGLFHAVFGRVVSREDWLTSLHQSLWPMIPAALMGCVLWILWLVLFHLAGYPGGFALDVVFQIAGHALGAWVYLNVFWNWYQLRGAGTRFQSRDARASVSARTAIGRGRSSAGVAGAQCGVNRRLHAWSVAVLPGPTRRPRPGTGGRQDCTATSLLHMLLENDFVVVNGSI